ncbi:sugar phosphate isomerase/epimerase family protein [Pseudolysinimonas yzui]|uniref:Xylose isomerase n=1 Tax=Pseudolysinimonas yzui TaxID=2708254 RepID=A0A8J3M2T3_9MICO|nr:sugar phosphate isomerase/epimerase [Pseudolysinimonas yzui]GHF26629.1 xylose isomerase [Pseudolysinimonas yzui]
MTPHTAQNWPIAAAMLPFPSSQDASGETWTQQLAQVAYEGFTEVDLTDSWVQVGDLDSHRLSSMDECLASVGLRPIAISVIRRSVIHPVEGVENLRYSHRTIDAAAALGIRVMSIGLHRALTPAQRDAHWFWTEPGPSDDTSPETWRLAAMRIRELGRHAEELGIQLSLEMYEDTLIGTVDGALRLVDDVDLPNVGINPDLANLYRLHRDVEDFLESSARCAPRANYWHVKSYFRDVDRTRDLITTVPAPMEYGSMNYRAAIASAISGGFSGPFCVEHYGGDGLSVAARNREYLQRMIAVAMGEAYRRVNERVAKGS